VTLGFIQFMKKIVGFNSTHPPITQIRVHSGLKKTNSTYPKPPKKGRIPALLGVPRLRLLVAQEAGRVVLQRLEAGLVDVARWAF
jgi:hypothetical protein